MNITNLGFLLIDFGKTLPTVHKQQDIGFRTIDLSVTCLLLYWIGPVSTAAAAAVGAANYLQRQRIFNGMRHECFASINETPQSW